MKGSGWGFKANEMRNDQIKKDLTKLSPSSVMATLTMINEWWNTDVMRGIQVYNIAITKLSICDSIKPLNNI